MNSSELKKYISEGKIDETLAELYGSEETLSARDRYIKAISAFESYYGMGREVSVFSVPGRSEISGNHTDHNRGKVIAASINLDIIAVASMNRQSRIRVKSRGFNEDNICLEDLSASSAKVRSRALICGVCDGFLKNGFSVGGFDAYTDSNVLKGSGLSSSAAFENMIGTILNHFFNNGTVDFIKLSQISQYAENVFFGKPSGLMDQIACAAGGFVGIDFADTQNPEVRRISFDLENHGYKLIIINSGGNHADLNDDYVSVPTEMKAVASYFGKNYLREVDEESFFSSLMTLREFLATKKVCVDRAILRAYHFFCENRRVEKQLSALERESLDDFLALVCESGRSSFCWLQNIYTCKNPSEQGLSLSLMLCESVLADKAAAWRVHGGGFAGTVQVFVKNEDAPELISRAQALFGADSAPVLSVRMKGAIKLL